jgi:high affinity Mn2+ porin
VRTDGRWLVWKAGGLLFRMAVALFLAWPAARAQDRGAVAASLAASLPDAPSPQTQDKDEPVTIFPHPESSRWWIAAQFNTILQWHPAFPAKYSGPKSLSFAAQSATSRVFTLYTGYELTPTTEVLADVESSSGTGIGNALGLAGYTNLDVVRIASGVTLSSGPPYLARLLLHQIIPLSRDQVAAERGPLGICTKLPARRLEFRLGKFSLVDFFDVNSVSGDSHLQFLNWTVDIDGAYDYAANTRGYTWGSLVEYDDGPWSLRFAEALMPKFANGPQLDADLARARAENAEVDWQHNLLGRLRPGRAGAIRVLSYVNHADMGSYREAINAFLSGQTPVPDIVKTRRQGRIKYGFATNFEQELTAGVRIFGRFGWNEGHNETFAFTEADQAIVFGGNWKGEAWHRHYDRMGGAFSLNAISPDHRRYLALGGSGFELGDGRLNYAREQIFEGYYTAHVWRGVFVSFDLEHITNPGYNQDRGPVLVPSARLHLDF